MLDNAALMKSYEVEVDSPLTDSLTGLFNCGFFNQLLLREIERSNRYGEPFALALLDMDSFKVYNKRHGPFKGDRVLKEVAEIIKDKIRDVDLAARFSGDVFAIIYTNSDVALAASAAERITDAVVNVFDGDPTVSMGLVSFPTDARSPEGLLSRAEEVLVHAKMWGKNKIYYFDSAAPISPNKPVVLVVDDEPTNVKLVEAFLFQLDYKILKAYGGEDALAMVRNLDVDLILLDIMMPGMDGYEVCRRIKGNDATCQIPVLMVTALDDTEAKVKALDAGADDFVTKPLNRVELLARMKSLLRIKSLNDSLSTIEKVLMSLANTVEAKEEYSPGHVQRVASLAVTMGRRMGLPARDVDAIKLGGILHDIGKRGVPPDILNKPGKLDDDEWEVVRGHADVGFQISLPLAKNLTPALEIIRHHHERLDGSGYPDGLSAGELSVRSQIVTIVDMYDSMTTDQPYRRALSQEKAFEILWKETNDGKLDRAIVQQLIDIVGNADIDGQ